MGILDEIEGLFDKLNFNEIIEFLDKVIEEATELKERLVSFQNLFGGGSDD